MLHIYRTISLLIKTPKIKLNTSLKHRLTTSLLMASNSLPESPHTQRTPVTTEANLRIHRGLINNDLLYKIISEDVLALMQCFSRHGYSTKVVGGAVRDLILGREPHDLDLCTDATPKQMLRFLGEEGYRTILVGVKHGTVMVMLKREGIEVTTLRVDKVTDGRHAEVEFTKQWELDAERRDFTVNALYLDLSGGVADFFSGVEDLKARRLRFVKDPEQRIQEDYLRILRYFRFYGRINEGADLHEPHTLEAIRNNAKGIKRISVERIWQETQQILTGRYAPHLMQVIYHLGVAEHMNLPQPGNHQELERVWGVHACGKYKLRPATLLMALLEGGDEHSVGDFCTKWKMATVEKKLAILIVKQRTMECDDVMKHCKDLVVDGTPLANVIEVMVYKDRPVQEIQQLEDWERPKFPVTGEDLMEIGLTAKKIGDMKTQLFKIWKESYKKTREELMEIAIYLLKE